MHVKSVPIGRVKAGPEDGLEEGQFIVYPSTFTKEPDSYGDVVAKGAFLDTIAEWKDSGNTLPGLYGHRLDDPDYFVAGALEMDEDEHGWRVKGEFDLESPKGPQVYRLVKGRRLNQLSFAFDVLDQAPVELEGGVKANELRKLKVYEFSFVPIGANQDTSVVAVKALADAAAAEFKAGRVLAEKHIDSLRSAQEAIGAVIKAAEASNDQEGKASGTPAAKPGASDEAPSGGKSSAPGEEQQPKSSVERLAAQAKIYALTGSAEGGSL
jgi:HK97 family phage prohead protease